MMGAPLGHTLLRVGRAKRDGMTITQPPPGPPVTGGNGNQDEWRQDPLDFLRRSADKYGDVVLLQFDRPMYLLNRPDLIDEVLQNKQGIFVKDILPTDHQGGHNPESLKYEVFRSLLGQNVLTS